PGFGGFERIRHTVSPLITWDWSPETEVPEDYANAFRTSGSGKVASPATNVLRISLSQNFEAKKKRAPGDTLGTTQQQKIRLLSINTSGIGYDFVRAKEDSLTGWMDASIGNTLASDLLPGFDFSMSHGLWDGPVGVQGTKFDLFLQSINAGFMIDGSTIRGIGALFGLSDRPTDPATGPVPGQPLPSGPLTDPRQMMQQRTLAMSNQLSGARRAFNMRVNYSLNRTRPAVDSLPVISSSTLNLVTQLSPTRYWGINWITQYNITTGKFESNTLNLTRDLHDWRAGFNFVRNPNGNFAFYVSIHLIDLPDLKVDYNQRTTAR
ncbi:MAG: putative LPS assembly protein LptD, partial [Gemmatimonadota bacterium]